MLRDLSLEVESGEVVGLLGPNGAGKTTAFYMIVGLTSCEHGEIFLDNKDISRLPMHRRAQLGLGYLPQEPSIFRKLSVADNILAILETRPGLDDAGRTARLKELLGELHIGHVRDSLGIEPVRRGSAAGWKLPGRWPRIRNLSSWMNRLRASTRSPWPISNE